MTHDAEKPLYRRRVIVRVMWQAADQSADSSSYDAYDAKITIQREEGENEYHSRGKESCRESREKARIRVMPVRAPSPRRRRRARSSGGPRLRSALGRVTHIDRRLACLGCHVQCPHPPPRGSLEKAPVGRVTPHRTGRPATAFLRPTTTTDEVTVE
jgi:hypothetical protein